MTADLSREELDALAAAIPGIESDAIKWNWAASEMVLPTSTVSSLIAMAGRMLEATQRAEQFQRERAALSDKLNGTPCAEIRWLQEKAALQADLAAARERIAALEGAVRAFLRMIKPDADDIENGRKDALDGLPDSHTFELAWAPEEPGNYITAGQIRRAARLLTVTSATERRSGPR